MDRSQASPEEREHAFVNVIGLMINIDAESIEAIKNALLKEGKNKSEVRITVMGETKDFTMKDFLTRLGFDNCGILKV